MTLTMPPLVAPLPPPLAMTSMGMGIAEAEGTMLEEELEPLAMTTGTDELEDVVKVEEEEFWFLAAMDAAVALATAESTNAGKGAEVTGMSLLIMEVEDEPLVSTKWPLPLAVTGCTMTGCSETGWNDRIMASTSFLSSSVLGLEDRVTILASLTTSIFLPSPMMILVMVGFPLSPSDV